MNADPDKNFVLSGIMDNRNCACAKIDVSNEPQVFELEIVDGDLSDVCVAVGIPAVGCFPTVDGCMNICFDVCCSGACVFSGIATYLNADRYQYLPRSGEAKPNANYFVGKHPRLFTVGINPTTSTFSIACDGLKDRLVWTIPTDRGVYVLLRNFRDESNTVRLRIKPS